VGYDLYAQYKYRQNQRYGYQAKAEAFRHAGNNRPHVILRRCVESKQGLNFCFAISLRL
jgi:hypothetical protein